MLKQGFRPWIEHNPEAAVQGSSGGMIMNLWKSIFAISALGFAVAACESNPKFKEDMLASSGFKQVPSTTGGAAGVVEEPAAHKLVPTTRKGKVVWAYSDPTICDACMSAVPAPMPPI